jgi:hypothetical protein
MASFVALHLVYPIDEVWGKLGRSHDSKKLLLAIVSVYVLRWPVRLRTTLRKVGQWRTIVPPCNGSGYYRNAQNYETIRYPFDLQLTLVY